LVAEGHDDGLFLGRFELIGIQRARGGEGFLVEILIQILSDDGGAEIDHGAKAAGVIEMMVGVDNFGKRLVGIELLDFGKQGERAGFTQRSFNQGNVISEFNEDAVVGAAGEVINAVGNLFRGDCDGGNGGRRGGGPDGDGSVGFGVGHDEDGRGKATLLHDHDAGNFDAAEILVVVVGGLDEHVAENIVVDPGADAHHHVLVVQVTLNLVFVLQGKGDDGVLHVVEGAGAHGGGIRHGAFEEGVRSDPEVILL